MARLATLARVDETVVYAATLASFAGTVLDLAGLDPADRYPPIGRSPHAAGPPPTGHRSACPASPRTAPGRLPGVSSSSARVQTTGAFSPATAHRAVGRSATSAHSRLGRVGSAPVYGNSLGQGPLKQCQHDLTRLPRESASPGVLATQARIDSALAGHSVPVLGQLAERAAYLAVTTLLLHLAGQPGADRLAPWVADLALIAAERTSTRGPRWGMRPPDDPALRGEALATGTRSWPPTTSMPQPRC